MLMVFYSPIIGRHAVTGSSERRVKFYFSMCSDEIGIYSCLEGDCRDVSRDGIVVCLVLKVIVETCHVTG